jgi:hypothetical protein
MKIICPIVLAGHCVTRMEKQKFTRLIFFNFLNGKTQYNDYLMSVIFNECDYRNVIMSATTYSTVV